MASALDMLFGSEFRVLLLRFFLLNPDTVFSKADIVKKAGVRSVTAQKELKLLGRAGFIKKAIVMRELPKRKSRRTKKQKIKGFSLNSAFPLLKELKRFLISGLPLAKEKIAKDFRKLGKIKAVILAGIFLDDPSSRVDLFLVGEDVKKRRLERILKRFERELGKDLHYALMTQEEFEYRYGMHDRFIRDLLDHPHETIFDSLKIKW